MLAKVVSGSVLGMAGQRIELEVHMGYGMTGFRMVGLPEASVREAQVRVQSAMCECGFDWPTRPVYVNLAPGDVRKNGTNYDLPLALAMLAADSRIPVDDTGTALSDTLVVGELGFSGELRAVRGALPLAIAAREMGLRRMIVPRENGAEAAVVEGLEVLGASHLGEVLDHAKGRHALDVIAPGAWSGPRQQMGGLDLIDVKGQAFAKRALEVAAAGGHNLLMIGPPGSGKTMLARRMPTILPKMSFEEALETTSVYSVAALLPGEGLISERPFRAPHHTISDVGLVGGGPQIPRPGEVSLAHHGVLFLDELPEFKRHALEVLRQPLEDGSATISRSLATVEYPARVMLVASMNPCPCGYLGSQKRACTCEMHHVLRYRSRISGPLLDRIDIQVEVPDVSYGELRERQGNVSSAEVRERVEAAREVQRVRFEGVSGVFCNAQMRPSELREHCEVDGEGHRVLERVVDRLGMSGRAYDRILKVSRTLADLEGEEAITVKHLSEAVGFRALDREVE